MEIKKIKDRDYCIECARSSGRNLVKATHYIEIGGMVSQLCDKHFDELKEQIVAANISK